MREALGVREVLETPGRALVRDEVVAAQHGNLHVVRSVVLTGNNCSRTPDASRHAA